MIRKTGFIVPIYFLIVIGFGGLFGFGIDTTINVFIIFTTVSVASLFFILITGLFVEIYRRQRQNPYLTPLSHTERAQNPEEWIEKVMHEIENGTIREVTVSPPSKYNLFIRKVVAISTSIIVASTILISLINTYIFSQFIPDVNKFDFWARFSITSLVFLTISYILVDTLEKRRLSSQKDVTIQHGFEIPKRNQHKSINIGLIMLLIIVFTYIYLYLTGPKEILDDLFTFNSPIFILYLIFGVLSIFFIIVGFLIRLGNK